MVTWRGDERWRESVRSVGEQGGKKEWRKGMNRLRRG